MSSAAEALRVGSDAENRLFPITSYGDDFVTGVCADGRQVVMGLLCPHVVAYFFDPDGRLVGDEHRPWNHPAPRMGLGDGPYQIYDKPFRAALDTQLREWQESIGYCRGPIRVRAFLDPRHPVGVTPVPDHLDPPEDEWRELDEEERQDLEQARAEWLARGQFVWWWAKDYWTAPDGRVVST
jgi:hypothetical protein